MAVSEFLSLIALRGFWPMSSTQSSGNTLDYSGQGLNLTYNGNPTYNYTTQGGGYIDFDGTGDYLSHADTADLDIVGTETTIATASRGLTLGGWYYLDSTSGQPSLIGKHDNSTAAGSAYLLYVVSGAATFQVYNGANSYGANGDSLVASTWYFIVGRFTPSSEIAVWVNTAKATSTTSIPASLNNVAAAFQVGARAGGATLDGRAAMQFVCAAALPDNVITNLFTASRSLYGV